MTAVGDKVASVTVAVKAVSIVKAAVCHGRHDRGLRVTTVVNAIMAVVQQLQQR